MHLDLWVVTEVIIIKPLTYLSKTGKPTVLVYVSQHISGSMAKHLCCFQMGHLPVAPKIPEKHAYFFPSPISKSTSALPVSHLSPSSMERRNSTSFSGAVLCKAAQNDIEPLVRTHSREFIHIFLSLQFAPFLCCLSSPFFHLIYFIH